MTDAKEVRIIQDTCCPETWVVARTQNVLHNAEEQATIRRKHQCIHVRGQPNTEKTHSEDVNSARVQRLGDHTCGVDASPQGSKLKNTIDLQHGVGEHKQVRNDLQLREEPACVKNVPRKEPESQSLGWRPPFFGAVPSTLLERGSPYLGKGPVRLD